MSVITFVNNVDEESGKTMSLVSIATNMAIMNNQRILIISTTNREDRIKSCYFTDQNTKNLRFGLLRNRPQSIETESGIEGLAKIARSNKLTPQMITNYTKVIFKDRLEVILGVDKNKKQDIIDDDKEIAEEYITLVNVAKMYYDKVFVDLDFNLSPEVREKIVDSSDLVIVNSSQNYNSIKKLKEKKDNSKLLQSPKTMILIGKYDKFSKYNIKNISRFLDEKKQVLGIPYNTLFMEATNEAGVPDFFLTLKRISNSDDRNALFIQEVDRATQGILYRLQELQTMR